MSEQYKRELLRIACAQICQTIGYNSTTTSSLEILQDLLQRFILEFSKNLRQHVELCNRTTPTLYDVALTLSSLNININELQDYVGNVEPVSFVVDVPKFPAAKTTNLNFLKPGSKEVLTRPVHVFEHLPPMLPSEENYALSANKAEASKNLITNAESSGYRASNEPESDSAAFPASNILATLAPASKIHDERATREISSVVMTTGGFISPAIEGKLPEAGLPAIIDKLLGLDAPPPPTPPPASPDLETAPEQKSPELLEKLPKLNVAEAKETKKPVVIESNQPQTLIRKNLKSHLIEGPHALKHLKKTKKKSPSTGSMVVANMSSLSLQEILNLNVEKLNEKGRRKRLKLLQKLLKNPQNYQDFESAQGISLSAYVADLPPGVERLTLEKLLKKHAKQKLKLLKKRKQIPGDTLHLNTIQQAPGNNISEINKRIPSEVLKTSKSFDLLGAQPINCESKQPNNVESISAIPILETEHITEAVTENTTKALNLKLSTEPDRSKLNIFKKISKAQKAPLAANSQAPVITPGPMGLFTGSEGEIINLPTGTTITPAPLMFNAPIGQESGGILPAAPSVIANLPKKRGRKPGSKNQPKPLNLHSGMLGATNSNVVIKKPKKLKPPKHVFAPENLNALATVPTLDQSLTINPQNLAPILPTALKSIPRKERKEKSEKNKFIPEAFDQSHDFSKSITDNSNLNIKAEPYGIGSVHLKPIDLLLNDPNQEQLQSTKTKKRSPYQNQSQKKVTQPNLLSTFPPPGFPPLAQNMLPMFPFSFTPRPGLIPAPGLFAPGPTGIPAFPNQPNTIPGSTASNVPNTGLMGLAAQFFPYAATNAIPSPNLKDRGRDLPAANIEQRNYCNVAPLVPPETIKLVGGNISSKSSKQKNDSISCHTSPTNLSRKSFVDDNLSAKLAQTGNIGDPIEVSDDSDEVAMPSNIKPFDKISTSDSMSNSAAKALYPSPQMSTLPSASSSLMAKKPKKAQKVSSFPQTDPGIEVFPIGNEVTHRPNFDGGFGKLAGGADLIPLSNATSGSAYSSKSIPANSLTASARQISPTSLVSQPIYETNKSTNANASIFNDLTITPTTISALPENSLKKKNKERKKLRKLKDGSEGKVKKKKDKKDKLREKERIGLFLKENNEERPLDYQKECLKKFKKEKKKEKQRFKDAIKANPDQNPDITQHSKHSPEAPSGFLTQLSDIIPTTSPEVSNFSATSASSLPKLTLKIGTGCHSPATSTVTKISDEEPLKANQKLSSEREPSPELARFSPLVTRPPKQKVMQQNENVSADAPPESNKSVEDTQLSCSQSQMQDQQQALLPPPSPWLSGSTLTASSVLLPQQLMSSNVASTSSPKQKSKTEQPQRHNLSKNTPESTGIIGSPTDPVSLIKETNRPSSYVDAEGNTVWICPACGKVDDGSPMIGCDGCDAWYHWECVGIAVAPKDNEDWFCRVCITRRKGFHGSNDGGDKKRKRNKKKVV